MKSICHNVGSNPQVNSQTKFKASNENKENYQLREVEEPTLNFHQEVNNGW